MSETVKGVAPSVPKGKRGVRGCGPDLGAGASTSARRLAAAILEVLAGSRTPLQAAQVLGLSLPRYYQLEVRALQGLLLACEPRRVGRVATAESVLASLQRECEQLRRECARQQALVRAAQRAIGLAAPAVPAARPMREGKKRRQRRPVARALRAAARLQPPEAAASLSMDKPEAVQG